MAKINKKRKKQKMTAFLPDLVTDILLRLPVLSLLRFRCLSASVCTDIDSAHFVRNHLNRSIQSKTGQKVIIRNSDSTEPFGANFADNLQVAAPFNNSLSESPPHSTFVCGSCNGLILLSIIGRVQNDTFFNRAIWNPFTRKYKKLPLHPVQTLPAGHKTKTITRYGLGYDSTLDDYKFVMITEVSPVSFQVWILSLKSNCWRKSQDLPIVDDKCNSSVGRFADGALYWKSKDNVLGFDVAHEVFFEVPLFFYCGQTTTPKDFLVVLAGNLYVPVRDYPYIHYYLLVRDKGGEAAGGSWRKKFTLDYKRRNFDLLAYSEEGNSILVSKSCRVFWYNLEKKTKEWVAANVPLYSEVVCCESLVSLGDNSLFDGAADKVVIYDLER